MTFNNHSPDISAVSALIAQAFDTVDALHLLPGGEGRTYRAGNVIYRCEANVAEASYQADVYHRLPEIGFRVPKPIRAKQGGWISPTGCSACTIDLTPYWRPPEFALAVLAYWLGPYRGDTSILPAFGQVQEFDQMLVRAALRSILITHEFSKLGGSLEKATEEYQPSVAIIAEWMHQRERL